MYKQELIEIHSNQSLAMDLRLSNMDANSSHKLNIIKSLLLQHGAVIVRNFSCELSDVTLMIKAIKGCLFYQSKELGYVHTFETVPFQQDILSISLECGAFHTDFWTREEIPDFVLLQCVRPDPKHPFYSRNQIVSVENLLKQIEKIYPKLLELLKTISIPHRVGTKEFNVKLLKKNNSGKFEICVHPKYIAKDLLQEIHYINGITVTDFISEVAKYLSYDFALNSSDIVIVSNKLFLHRRGEASVDFSNGFTNPTGRKINTFRFSL